MKLFGKKEKKQDPSVDDWFWDSFLINEANFRNQQETVKRSSKDNPITLGYILKELLNIDLTDIGSMTIVSRGMSELDNKTEIIKDTSRVLEYNPYETVLYTDSKGEILPMTGQNTVLIISYRPASVVYNNIESKHDKSISRTENSIIMFLRVLRFLHETAYMRVSVMIPNFSDTDDFRTSQSKNIPFTTSFILGYDIVPPESKLKRFDAIEKSLVEKAKKGVNRENLTNEEKIILQTYTIDIGAEFRYGRWLVSEKRFADALRPLMAVYEHLKTRLATNFEQLHEIFHETCFYIGFCFNEMEQFDRAAYYFSLIQDGKNIKYTIEYICAMVNNSDPRSMSLITRYIQEFNDGTRKSDSEESATFYEFLHRRLAYLFIEYKMWDEARNLLERLKEWPSCHDFAVDELKYLDYISQRESK